MEEDRPSVKNSFKHRHFSETIKMFIINFISVQVMRVSEALSCLRHDVTEDPLQVQPLSH